MTDSLDPAWAGIIGAAIGAASAIISGGVGPVVRDVLARRAARTETDRETRQRVGFEVLEILDGASEDTPGALARIEKLQPQIDLVDRAGEYSAIAQFAVMEQSGSGVFGRALARGYANRLTLAWIRGEKLPGTQEFVDKSEVLRRAAEPIDAKQPPDPLNEA